MRNSRHSNSTLTEDLKNAIQRNEIHLLYQPIVDLNENTISGFEALMRWHHPKLGELMPSDFIPLAEQSGEIHRLGNYVLNRALSEFNSIRGRENKDCYISVNVSSRELLKSEIVHDIANALLNNGLPARALRLEVTESLVMENPEHASQILNRIKNTGVGLSLDDFGTGYSSLSYLLRFPFDTLKIDKSFVQSRLQREKIVVLRSIITLAQGLDQNVVAEGVEYESEAADLLQLGCQYGQGFFFGKPVPVADASKLLETG